MEKIVLALGLAVLVATSVYLSQESTQVQENEIRMIYNMWKEQQGRKYGSSENEFRFNVFKSNYDIVLANNIKFELGLESVELNMNQFADLTNEEFQARYLNLQQQRRPMRGANRQVFTGENVEIPTSVDWRTSGAVNAVKNQGSCGSCWAFSAVAAIEGALKISTGTLYNLSEQELVDCAGGVYGNEGCNGGWMDEAFAYVIDNKITTQSAYPYTGKDGTCRSASPKVGITSFADVDELSESALLAAIAQQPVSVAINAGGIFFQLYSKGVFTNACAGGADKLNHGVVAVGYGNESSKDYYLVRNSWGSTWGEAGYIKLVRKGDGDGQCGIQDAASYPVA